MTIPTMECLVGGIAVHATPIVAPQQEEPTEADKFLNTLRTLTAGLDFQKVLPKLADVGLRIIEETQIPELFNLLDPLVSISEGTLDLGTLKVHVEAGIEVVKSIPGEIRMDLGVRFFSAVSSIAEELRIELSSAVAPSTKENEASEEVRIPECAEPDRGTDEDILHLDGCEVTAPAISAALQCLLDHPDEKVRAAVREAVSAAVQAQEAPQIAGALECPSADSGPQDVPEGAAQDMLEPPESLPAVLSARVLGADVETTAAAHAIIQLPDTLGDVTEQFTGLLAQYPKVGQAFRLGQLHIMHEEPGACAIAKAIITNNGAIPWPETAALQCVAGPAYAFPGLSLGAVPAGETVELVLDFNFGPGQAGEAALSAWAMIDEYGEPFGPVLLLEVARG